MIKLDVRKAIATSLFATIFTAIAGTIVFWYRGDIVLLPALMVIIGSIIGLLYSYKQHGEPFIVKGLNVVMCVVSVIGWMLAVNCQFSQGLIAVGLLLAGFVIGERPGYGRIETLIGIIAAVIVYLIMHLI